MQSERRDLVTEGRNPLKFEPEVSKDPWKLVLDFGRVPLDQGPKILLERLRSLEDNRSIPPRTDLQRESDVYRAIDTYVKLCNAQMSRELKRHPVKAAKTAAVMKLKVAEMTGIYRPLRHPENFMMRLVTHVDEVRDPLAYFRSLPDGTLGLREVAEQIVRQHLELGDYSEPENWDVAKRTWEEKSPEILMISAGMRIRSYDHASKYLNFDELVRRIGLRSDAKLSLLASLDFDTFKDQLSPEAVKIMQRVFEQHKPSAILFNSDFFPDFEFNEQFLLSLILNEVTDNVGDNRSYLERFAGKQEVMKQLDKKLNRFHGLTLNSVKILLGNGFPLRRITECLQSFVGVDLNSLQTHFLQEYPHEFLTVHDKFTNIDANQLVDEMSAASKSLDEDAIPRIAHALAEDINVNALSKERRDVLLQILFKDSSKVRLSVLKNILRFFARLAEPERDDYLAHGIGYWPWWQHMPDFEMYLSMLSSSRRVYIIERFLRSRKELSLSGPEFDAFNSVIDYLQGLPESESVGLLESAAKTRSDQFLIRNHPVMKCSEVLFIDALNHTQSIALKYDLLKNNPELVDKVAWGPALLRLVKIQARSARDEYDRWNTDLVPLAQRFFKVFAEGNSTGGLNPESSNDADVFVDYVEAFGAVDTVHLFKAYVALRRAESMEDLDARVVEQLRNLFGEQVFKKFSSPGKVIESLKKIPRTMTAALLKDEIPDTLQSEIGAEILTIITGATKWMTHPAGELVSAWTATVARDPQLASLPNGYTEFSIEVRQRKLLDEDDAEATGIAKKQQAILDNPNTQAEFRKLTRGLSDVRQKSEDITRAVIEHAKTFFETQISSLSAMLENTQDEKPKASLIKKRDNLSSKLDELQRFEREAFVEDIDQLEMLVRCIQLLAKLKDKLFTPDDYLRSLSAAHMLMIAPEGFKATIETLAQSQTLDAGSLALADDFVRQYLNEHYLHQSQVVSHTGHEPFTAPELKSLQQAWGLHKGAERHPLAEARSKYVAISQGELTDKKTTVTLVPAQGLLRVFSGQVGDACYAKRDLEFAQGRYPTVHAMTFVTNRGKTHERIMGSVLFIETQSAIGEKVLMVRANNPRENLLGLVDEDALVAGTLEAAAVIAKRRGLDRVVVPRDPATASSSNRKKVAEYYQHEYENAPITGLKRGPETTFNGYQNWNARGRHAVVTIWENDQRSGLVPRMLRRLFGLFR